MENSISNMRPELVKEWSEKNYPLTPDCVPFGSNKLYWWRGSCGHEWQTSAKARSYGEGCPICSNARIVPGINDLQTLEPELSKNGLERIARYFRQWWDRVHIGKLYGKESAGMNGRQ